ncbi:MAG: aldo/keto reductase [Verrucomicrobia bacterium]|jgi:predicted oxidoreductase|nr:aldo/keto reductase [Verrucomicrobiota bacterium]
MKQIPIGASELRCGCLAYGCWRIAGAAGPAGPSPEAVAAGRRSVIAAYESGYTLFDNADIYGGGAAERILGQALREVSGMRERVVILTKGGVRHAGLPHPHSPQRYDLSAEHLIESCEGSLKRLGVETIDIYMLHRPDYLVDPGEVARAFTQLKEQGKVRHFGVSNFRPTLLAALQAACPMPIVTHQFEFSLMRLDPLTDGTLDQCLREDITPMAWSPLGGGMLADGAGRLLSWQQKYDPDPIKPVLDEVASAHGASRAVVALAWLMKHPARVMPIVGSTQPDRIREAARAASLELSREEWYRLLLAARGHPLD